MANNGQQFENSNGKRQSGSLGQTLPPPGETEEHVPTEEAAQQSPEGPVAPLTLDAFAAMAIGNGGTKIEGSGQFNGEDLEFESFMFDSGDLEGVQLEHQQVEGAISPALSKGEPGSEGSTPVAEAVIDSQLAGETPAL